MKKVLTIAGVGVSGAALGAAGLFGASVAIAYVAKKGGLR